MDILLATQGSQGVVAIRELFSQNMAPDKIHVAVCANGANGPLLEFISYNKMSCSFHKSGGEFTSWLMSQSKSYNVLLSISWKYLFCEQVIEYFDGMAINFHPGILPTYRGCFSTPWSIINGETEVGFTYHYISKNFDEGNILLEGKTDINKLDTAHSLNYRLFQLGLSRLNDALQLIGRPGKPQGPGGRYYPNCLPFDGKLDDEWSDSQKDLFVRAMYFPPYER